MDHNPFVTAFTTIYVLTFREATKVASGWGAFYGHRPGLFVTKLIYSLLLIVLLPLVVYVPFSKVVERFSIDASVGPSLLPGASEALVIAILLGVFPRAPKHVWNLWSRRQIAKGRPEEDLFDWKISPVRDLPRVGYSWQVVFALGVAPITIIAVYACRGHLAGVRPYASWEDWTTLFMTAYVGQAILFYNIRKARNSFYFYQERNPQRLISWRMWVSVPCTILLPAAFGILSYFAMLWLHQKNSRYYAISGILGLVIVLPFPYYCDQITLLVAKKRNWIKESDFPELYQVPRHFWTACILLAIMCLALAISVFLWSDFPKFFAGQSLTWSEKLRRP